MCDMGSTSNTRLSPMSVICLSLCLVMLTHSRPFPCKRTVEGRSRCYLMSIRDGGPGPSPTGERKSTGSRGWEDQSRVPRGEISSERTWRIRQGTLRRGWDPGGLGSCPEPYHLRVIYKRRAYHLSRRIRYTLTNEIFYY